MSECSLVVVEIVSEKPQYSCFSEKNKYNKFTLNTLYALQNVKCYLYGYVWLMAVLLDSYFYEVASGSKILYYGLFRYIIHNWKC